MGERRQEVLEKALEYLLRNGVAGLSLRPLAAKAGTSARLLVYHFGSKEGLLTAVMDEARARAQASLQKTLESPSRPGNHPLIDFWKGLTTPANTPYLRLLFEVQVLALQNPKRYGRYLEQSSMSWLDAIERALPPALRSRDTATLYVAVVDGLLLELLTTGDRRRTTRALELFVKNQMQCATRPPKQTTKRSAK